MSEYDLVIRGGNIADGSGEPIFAGDVAVKNGKIAAIGAFPGQGEKEIEATGRLITPGFVDVHTHYDGQAAWSNTLDPSSGHGVTTIVMGNCGVGFAPCKSHDHDRLISLMEGVEDIPNPVLAEGLPWNWESFPDYLKAISAIPHDIDYAALFPHGPLRVYVMGERGANREDASEEDISKMAALTEEALEAGAMGFSTSRTLNHRTAEGEPTPCYDAAEKELLGIAAALGKTGKGVLQFVTDFAMGTEEGEMLKRLSAKANRPLYVSMAQAGPKPDMYRDLLDFLSASHKEGVDVNGQVCGRPVGICLGLNASMNPFSLNPAYQAIAGLALPERVAAMREGDRREAILKAASNAADNAFNAVICNFNNMYVLGENCDYEQPEEATIASMAEAKSTTPEALVYDILLEKEGEQIVYTPFLNYAEYSLEPSLEMMRHPHTILGLGDGGAHVGMICDGSFPTSMLTHWTRDRTRGEKLPIEWVISAQTRETAEAFGLYDRGVLAKGMKADINIIDYDNLKLHPPYMVHDLPAGGKRLMQKATGYDMTIVSGEIIRQHGEVTGNYPGQLVRGSQAPPS